MRSVVVAVVLMFRLEEVPLDGEDPVGRLKNQPEAVFAVARNATRRGNANIVKKCVV